MRTTLALSLIALSALGLADTSDEKSLDILRTVLENEEEVRYAGIRTVYMRFGPELKTHKEYVLRANGKTRIDFDANSDFAGQVIYEQDHRRFVLIKAKNELKTSSRRPVGDQLEIFFDHHHRGPDPDLKYYGYSRVAGRVCHKIIADFGRFFTRFYVDKEHSVILKRDAEDHNGVKFAGYSFTKIDFTPDFKASHLDPPKGAKIVTVYDTLAEESKSMGFQPFGLAEDSGWRLVHVSKIDQKEAKVLRSFYVKGRFQVSLAQMKESTDVSDMKEFVPRGNELFIWTEDGYKFALIGNLSEYDLRRLARRVSLRKLP